jgi:hypothetical protein
MLGKVRSSLLSALCQTGQRWARKTVFSEITQKFWHPTARLRDGRGDEYNSGKPGRIEDYDHDRSLIIHRPPRQDWYATQDAVRGVLLCNRAGEEMVKVEPPFGWGRHWQWNLTEDASGIYFRNI